MHQSLPQPLTFTPSAVIGLDAVSSVTFHPDFVEFHGPAHTARIDFVSIARWTRFAWFYRLLVRLGLGVRGSPLVGDRDWFHPPSGRYFRFYTSPQITIYLPNESENTSYDQTLFRRIQAVLESGGFSTLDCG